MLKPTVFVLILIQSVHLVKCLRASNNLTNTCLQSSFERKVPDNTPNSIYEKCNVSLQLKLDALLYKGFIKIELFYEFADIVSSKGPYLKITLMQGDQNSLINCADTTNFKRVQTFIIENAFGHLEAVGHIYRSAIDCTSQDLEPGNYCISASISDPVQPCFYYSQMVELVKAEVDVLPLTPSVAVGYMSYIVISISLLVVALFIIVGVIGVKLYRRDGVHVGPIHVVMNRTRQKVFKAIMCKPRVSVFLVYYPDCPHHFEVIRQLSAFLNCNNCVTSYDAIEKESIAINKVGWLDHKLNGNHKVLIVNSRGACFAQQTWLKNRSCNEDDNHQGNIFTMALANLMNDPSKAYDYSKVFMLRPKYVSEGYLLKNLIANKNYSIPDNLVALLCNLHDVDSSVVCEDESAGATWDHCTLAYTDLRIAIDALTSSEEAKVPSDLGCHLCLIAYVVENSDDAVEDSDGAVEDIDDGASINLCLKIRSDD